MIPYIRRFERDGYTLVVDTATKPGERLVTREYKNGVVDTKTVGVTPPKKQPSSTHRAGAARPNRTDCVHFDGSAGRTVGHACGGCNGNQFTTVGVCELFGDCAPLAWAPLKADGAGVRRCIDCAAYKPTAAA